jgi:hypothetical protein
VSTRISKPSQKLLHHIWDVRAPRIAVDDLVTGARVLLQDADFGPDTHSFKVNDLYLEFEEVRRLSLGERIASVMAELLGDTPVLVKTLNFERGSQQAYHVDSLFMTPRTVGNLAATWIALEDCHLNAGPLAYFPERNHIVPFQCLGGGYHIRSEEMAHWEEYVLLGGGAAEPRTATFRCPDRGRLHLERQPPPRRKVVVARMLLSTNESGAEFRVRARRSLRDRLEPFKIPQRTKELVNLERKPRADDRRPRHRALDTPDRKAQSRQPPSSSSYDSVPDPAPATALEEVVSN